ncbi:MAG TPA: APC family permease [Pseudonocardia sp.]|nr:APC family permease [Pseudonocardia sp.]
MAYTSRIADQLRSESPMSGLDRRNLAAPQVFAQSVSGVAPAAAMAVTPAIVAEQAGVGTVWSFAIATGLVLLVASCIGQFTRRMAAAGSLYSLTAKGLGAAPGLVCGAALLVGYGLLSMAALVGAALELGALAAFVGLPRSAFTGAVAVALVVVAAVVATCAIRGVRLAASVVLLAEAVSISLMLVVFVILLASHPTVVHVDQLIPSQASIGGVVAGALPALAAFIGFETAVALGVEARRPFRTVPRAVRGTAALTGVLTLFAAYTQVARFPEIGAGLVGQDPPAPVLAGTEHVSWLPVVLDVGLATSFFACALATTTALVRLLLSAGREQVLPAWLGRTHPRLRTPHHAVAVTVPVIALVPLGLFTIGVAPGRALTTLLTIAALGYLVAYLLVCLAAPVFLHRIGELTVAPIIQTALIVPVLLVVFGVFVTQRAPLMAPALVGAAVILGLGRYLWIKIRHPRRISAIGLYDETSAADVWGARVRWPR